MKYAYLVFPEIIAILRYPFKEILKRSSILSVLIQDIFKKSNLSSSLLELPLHRQAVCKQPDLQ